MSDGMAPEVPPPDSAAARPAPAAVIDPPSPDEVREALQGAVAAGPGGPARIKEVAEGAPVGALADAIGELPVEAMRQVLSALGPERLAEVIAEVDPQTAAEVLLRLTRPEAADVLDEMDPDDAADVIGELRDEDAPAAEQLLQEMEPEEAADVRQLLTYPEDTAGGIMTTDFISVPATDTVGQVVRRVRAPGADDVPEESASYVYVSEPGGQLAGVVPWHRLVRAGERVPVRSLISPQVVSVPASADQETVARVVRDYRLLAVPVVDDQGALLGIVTADDVAEVEEEEATEDIERLSGAQPLDEPYLRAGPFLLARKRVFWLLLLFLGATYTGTVLQHFQGQLDAVVALSFFIPMLIGTGGNAGSQTVMTVIRALSVGEISSRDVARVWLKEATTGLILGSVLGVAAAARAILLGVGTPIGLAVGLSAGAIILWSATVAAVLPLLLHRLRIDPAVVSAPLITTLVDGTGLFIYLSVATLLLKL
jgi:magnesium transporter